MAHDDWPAKDASGETDALTGELMRSLKATVVDLERIASDANRVAEKHRSTLTYLELKFEDAGITASERNCDGP